MQYSQPFKGLFIITVWLIGCLNTNQCDGHTIDSLQLTHHTTPSPFIKYPDLYQASLHQYTLRQNKDTVVPPPGSGIQPSVQPEADSILQNAMRPVEKEDYHKTHTAKGATLRSLVLPGWGQAYNHEYWKVPLAAAAVGVPLYLFIDNNKEYKLSRDAYNTVYEEMPIISGGKGKLDPKKFSELDQKFQDAYNNAKKNGGNYTKTFLSSIQNYRNTFRQYRDYSIIALLLGWGLNIADATVFGHLRGFDVGPDLSMKIRPVYMLYARTPGITLSFNLK